VADQQRPGDGKLLDLIEKGEGAGQAATDLGRRVVFQAAQKSLDLRELARIGLVVGQGLARGTGEEAAIVTTEQQSAGGACNGNGPNLLLDPRGNLEEKLEKALSPGLRMLEGPWVGGGLLLEGVP
jgi:hypothetical protein